MDYKIANYLPDKIVFAFFGREKFVLKSNILDLFNLIIVSLSFFFSMMLT